MFRHARFALALVFAAGSSACTPNTDDEPDHVCDEEPGENFAHIQEIFEENCVECHNPDGISGHVLLLCGNAYDDIFDDSTANVPFITPNDPSQSYLWLKINGMQETVPDGNGDPMKCAALTGPVGGGPVLQTAPPSWMSVIANVLPISA